MLALGPSSFCHLTSTLSVGMPLGSRDSSLQRGMRAISVPSIGFRAGEPQAPETHEAWQPVQKHRLQLLNMITRGLSASRSQGAVAKDWSL